MNLKPKLFIFAIGLSPSVTFCLLVEINQLNILIVINTLDFGLMSF